MLPVVGRPPCVFDLPRKHPQVYPLEPNIGIASLVDKGRALGQFPQHRESA